MKMLNWIKCFTINLLKELGIAIMFCLALLTMVGIPLILLFFLISWLISIIWSPAMVGDIWSILCVIIVLGGLVFSFILYPIFEVIKKTNEDMKTKNK